MVTVEYMKIVDYEYFSAYLKKISLKDRTVADTIKAQEYAHENMIRLYGKEAADQIKTEMEQHNGQRP